MMNVKCLYKKKIDTAKEAKIIARRVEGRAWYFCDICKYYHTGRKSR